MAKGKLTQRDLMIWTMVRPNGTKVYYLIEKEPFEKEGFKKATHRLGTTGDAVFDYRDQAEAELAKYPPGEAETAVDVEAGAAEDAGAESAADDAQ
jgi:hypothetical protein